MNIVFDIGNVICEWNPQKLVCSAFAKEFDSQTALEKIIGHLDWQNLDKGTIALDDAITRASKRTGLSVKHITHLFNLTPVFLVPFPETITIIKDLHRIGYPLYVLSNMHDYAFEYLQENFDFWKYFAGKVISSHIKKIKPEPAIYEYLLGNFSLVPSETVFLDDLQVNLDAAKKFGINTLKVDNVIDLKSQLYAFLDIR